MASSAALRKASAVALPLPPAERGSEQRDAHAAGADHFGAGRRPGRGRVDAARVRRADRSSGMRQAPRQRPRIRARRASGGARAIDRGASRTRSFPSPVSAGYEPMENCRMRQAQPACRRQPGSRSAWSSDRRERARLFHPRPVLRRADARARPLCRGDADRQSRRHHDPRARHARRRRPDRLRGHARHAQAARRATASARAASPPITSTATRRAHRPAAAMRSPRAARSRSSPTPARRSSPIPASASSPMPRAAGIAVVPIPGASSAARGALGGRAADRRRSSSLGFLPPKSAARRKRLAAPRAQRRHARLFESPNRIAALLADAVAELGERAAGGAVAASSPSCTRRSTAARWPSLRRAMPSAR